MTYIEVLVKNIEDYTMIIDDYMREYYDIKIKKEFEYLGINELGYESIEQVKDNLIDTIRELKRVMRIK